MKARILGEAQSRLAPAAPIPWCAKVERRLMSTAVAQSRINPYVVLAIQLSKVLRKEGV